MNGLACEKLKDFQKSLLPKLMLENSDSYTAKLSFIINISICILSYNAI